MNSQGNSHLQIKISLLLKFNNQEKVDEEENLSKDPELPIYTNIKSKEKQAPQNNRVVATFHLKVKSATMTILICSSNHVRQ